MYLKTTASKCGVMSDLKHFSQRVTRLINTSASYVLQVNQL